MAMASGENPVRLIVFDFDQTISHFHVYKVLAGWQRMPAPFDMKMPPPYSTTEKGQLARVDELSQLPQFKDRGGFGLVALGGTERLEMLRHFFSDMETAGVKVVLCTRGFVGPARKVLHDAGLLAYFSHVYGSVGGRAEDAYDLSIAKKAMAEDLSQFLGNSTNEWGTSKGLTVTLIMRDHGLVMDETIFVDDDEREIATARGVCRTMWVQSGQGITRDNLQDLRRLTGDVGAIQDMNTSARSGVCSCNIQ